jgi:hypothetical protein
MLRVLAFIRRRPDLGRDRFREHYEGVHVATALPVLGGLLGYQRQHVREALFGAPDFDCMTIFEYPDARSAGATFARIQGPEGDPIRRDEALFMDKAAERFFPAETGVAWRAGEAGDGDERLLVCLRRPAGETPEGFRARGEGERLPALRAALDRPRWCRAHWAREGSAFDAVIELACQGIGALPDWARELAGQGAQVVALRVSVHQTSLDG